MRIPTSLRLKGRLTLWRLPGAIGLRESAIDALSCHALHPTWRCLSTAGARPNPAWLTALLAQGQPLFCGFDADNTGEAMAECVTLVYGRDMQELIVVARAGKSLSTSRDPHYAPIEPFLTPIAVSVKDRGRWPGAPYPPSDFIQGIHWAPPESIIRKADGSRSRA